MSERTFFSRGFLRFSKNGRTFPFWQRFRADIFVREWNKKSQNSQKQILQNTLSTRGMLRWQRISGHIPVTTGAYACLRLQLHSLMMPVLNVFSVHVIVGFCTFQCTAWRACKSPLVLKGNLKLHPLVFSVFFIYIFFFFYFFCQPHTQTRVSVKQKNVNSCPKPCVRHSIFQKNSLLTL